MSCARDDGAAGSSSTRSSGWPDLLNEVHRFIEDHGLRFALLGSSARKLKARGTNLLAGRAVWKAMFPLMPGELGPDFDLATLLRYGSLPLVWTARERGQTLDAYVQLYLREEIKAEALVRNLPGFARFLPIAALFHGQVINVSAIARMRVRRAPRYRGISTSWRIRCSPLGFPRSSRVSGSENGSTRSYSGLTPVSYERSSVTSDRSR